MEWDETEVGWMRALDEARQALTCPLCGLPKSICRDSKNERKFTAEAERCFALAAIHRQQSKDEDAKMPDPGSLHYSVALT